MEPYDAVIVGSGPNGLAAAAALLGWGYSVCVIEGSPYIGGGLHSWELSEPGYIHDSCAAIHPMGVLSPFFQSLDLQEHGLRWCTGRSSVAHPLQGEPAAILYKDFERTGQRLGKRDGLAWRQLFEPFVARGDELISDLLGPLSLRPRDLGGLARFGRLAVRPAEELALSRFRTSGARSLFSGLAGHSILPLDDPLSSAFGLIFGISAHLADWPCAQGGSGAMARALEGKIRQLGGEFRVGERIHSLAQLPPCRVVLLDLAPKGVCDVASEQLPASYKDRLRAYRYGPGTYKLDWTLDGPIPWSDPEVNGASTVHVGGTLAEISASERAAWQGRAPTSPYLIVCQQSEMDGTRAPMGKHTGYGYCHVPHAFEGDLDDVIEDQVERFAPGFKDLIRTRHATKPRDFQRMNPNYVGGAVTGGAATFDQIFTRPVARLDPYSTPNEKLFLCSASTPPGGGVHGMCGYYAARSAVRSLGGNPPLLQPRNKH